MLTLLQQAAEARLLRPLDVQLARLLAPNDPCLAMLVSKVSAEAGSGHVCLWLPALHAASLFDGRTDEALGEAIWQKAGNPVLAEMLMSLNASPAVSDGSRPTPLVLQGQRLYLQRMWQDEGEIVSFFLRRSQTTLPVDVAQLTAVLAHFFPVQAVETDWQNVAAAVAATRQVAVISGGPGTGKTTTVARFLAVLLALQGQSKLRIALAAPTGKAAARLTESLGRALDALTLTDDQRRQMPNEAFTLHRLLGVQPNNHQRLRYHQGNPLHIDVLIVDEASMVDLPMMARLIEALPPHARLILLGDKDQLASVEAGAVLGDLCRFAEYGYSSQGAALLTQLTGYPIEGDCNSHVPAVRDSLCLLRKSYRFDAHSGIGQLALAVNRGDGYGAVACFGKHYADLAWHSLNSAVDYQRLLDLCVENYRHYLLHLNHSVEPQVILALFNQFRLLCALRQGPFGVDGLNQQIEQRLVQKGFIKQSPQENGQWYAGRPVMVSRNDRTLGLYNGDIGIALADEHDRLRVYFQLPDGSIKAVPPSRLPASETAFVMTVHKSQGSEFEHTALVFPDTFSPLLRRELVYTAITRAKAKLTLFAEESVLLPAIFTPTERHSGLAERLAAADGKPIN